MADRYEDTELQINNYDKPKICLGSPQDIDYGVIRHRGASMFAPLFFSKKKKKIICYEHYHL